MLRTTTPTSATNDTDTSGETHASAPAAASWIDRSASELAALVASGAVTATELLESHLARIAAVEPQINALAWRRFEEARADAAAIDRARAAGEPLGPLAGVPVSIKECFHLDGFPTSLGLSRLAETPVSFDGYLAQLLKRTGAVIIGKTNVPLAMLMYETDNPVFGRTNNPRDLARSPGGSSGGDAALVAAQGVPLSIAGDMAGSIRQPAHSCGVHGFKPSTGSVAHFGGAGSTRATTVIGAICGPIARSMDDIRLAARLMRITPGDLPETGPVDWASLLESTTPSLAGLKVGYYEDDGYFRPSPAIRRAVRESAEALRARGIEVVPIEIPEVRELVRLYYGLLSADGATELSRMVAGSKVDKRLERLLSLAKMPRWIRAPLALFARARGHKRIYDLLSATQPRSDEEFWALAARRKAVSQEFFARLKQRNIGALLAPPFPVVAIRHGQSTPLAAASSHCLLANLFECPAGVVAATSVQPGEESDRKAGGEASERAARRTEADSSGLPVGVQVMTPPGEDELALALMTELDGYWSRQAGYPLATRAR